jgi:predicted Fe-S protein YdhL (DUF1289 family)
MSACVSQCRIDKETQICRGCGRHIDEITAKGREAWAARMRSQSLKAAPAPTDNSPTEESPK